MNRRQEQRALLAIDALIANHVNPKQAAHALGISERTFWNWTAPLREKTRLTHAELAVCRAREKAA